jgi:hypothetical protein
MLRKKEKETTISTFGPGLSTSMLLFFIPISGENAPWEIHIQHAGNKAADPNEIISPQKLARRDRTYGWIRSVVFH